MSEGHERATGLLLRSQSYLGRDKILSVLTPDHGLLSLMVKGRAGKWSGVTTPFVVAEWVYLRGKKELMKLIDATLLDPLSALKNDYAVLSAAGQMAQDLLRTQMPGKPAQAPFALAVACLQKLAEFKEPRVLAAAFRLKLLIAEGLFEPEDEPREFSALAQIRSFQALAELPPDPGMLAAISSFFEERVGR